MRAHSAIGPHVTRFRLPHAPRGRRARGSYEGHTYLYMSAGVPATSHKLGAARFGDLATCGPPSRP
eukprot:3338557-Prymnesium_polylepis.2